LSPDSWWRAGEAARLAGRPREAVLAYRRLLACEPSFMPAQANLALVLERSGAVFLGRALALDPGHGLLWFNRGNLLGHAGSYRRALVLEPPLSGAWLNLGALALAAGAHQRALRAFARSAWLSASAPVAAAVALRNLGLVRLELGETAAALADFARALAADPGYWPAHADLIGALRLAEGIDAAAELAEVRRFAVAHARPPAPPAPVMPARDRDPERRLRVGYVGADAFRRHTAAVSLLPLIEAHDRSQVEVVCYSDVPAGGRDGVSGRFAALARVVDTQALSDAALAWRIAADGIDIAVDVIGHARGTRLLALAAKPAPVQASLLLMGSSGLPAMDYAIGDGELTPPGAERGFSERLLRIDRAFVYRPLLVLPALPALPALAARAEAGPVVFGSFNQLAKLQPGCIAAWSRLLERLPGSRLILRSRALGDAAGAARIAAAFAAHGIAAERLDLRGWARAQHLEAYGEIDIALDPFPYGGVITTLEALSMGVPVISLEGERVLGRYGGVFLRELGLGDLVAGDAAAYVEAAVALAQDRERRTRLRSSLRRRLAASRLADGRAFAGALEGAYRQMWRHWCAAPAAPAAP
jgi:protein O-GlcNAc transferase